MQRRIKISVQKYFETYAERFDGFYKKGSPSLFQKIVHNTLRRPGLLCRFKTTEKILGNVRNKTILDVGCGSGVYSIFFSKKGADVIGIDFSSTMITLSRENAELEQCKCNFILTDFLNYDTEHKFDSLLFIGVFDYIGKDEIYQYFEKAVKLTSDNLVVTFPKLFAFQSAIRYAWLKQQNCPVYYYTKKKIRKLAEDLKLHTSFYNCGPIWVVEFKICR